MALIEWSMHLRKLKINETFPYQILNNVVGWNMSYKHIYHFIKQYNHFDNSFKFEKPTMALNEHWTCFRNIKRAWIFVYWILNNIVSWNIFQKCIYICW